MAAIGSGPGQQRLSLVEQLELALVGGLLAAGDTLQLFAKVPAASTIVLQALLFIAALAASGLQRRRVAA